MEPGKWSTSENNFRKSVYVCFIAIFLPSITFSLSFYVFSCIFFGSLSALLFFVVRMKIILWFNLWKLYKSHLNHLFSYNLNPYVPHLLSYTQVQNNNAGKKPILYILSAYNRVAEWLEKCTQSCRLLSLYIIMKVRVGPKDAIILYLPSSLTITLPWKTFSFFLQSQKTLPILIIS